MGREGGGKERERKRESADVFCCCCWWWVFFFFGLFGFCFFCEPVNRLVLRGLIYPSFP